MYDKFTKELLKWNKIHKLTNYNEEEIKSQVEDSLYPLEKIKNSKTALDVGTGAGFPGLILAIAMPETKWYLVEPLKKRYSFLNYIKTILNLKNVEVIPKRVEEANIEPVDLITSRAVMDTRKLLHLTKPYIKNDTTILLYKGSNVFDEIKDIKSTILTKGNRNYIFIKGKDISWEN